MITIHLHANRRPARAHIAIQDLNILVGVMGPDPILNPPTRLQPRKCRRSNQTNSADDSMARGIRSNHPGDFSRMRSPTSTYTRYGLPSPPTTTPSPHQPWKRQDAHPQISFGASSCTYRATDDYSMRHQTGFACLFTKRKFAYRSTRCCQCSTSPYFLKMID